MTRDLDAMRAACEAGYVSTADYVKAKENSMKEPLRWQKVIGWLDDAEAAIHNFPAVVWLDDSGIWWTGTPGNYLNLRDSGWTVTRWLPFESHLDDLALEATVGDLRNAIRALSTGERSAPVR